MMPFGLEEKNYKRIKNVFRLFPHVEEVVIFGSRALGTDRPGSDVDLALKGEKIDIDDLLNIRGKLEELPLAYNYDIVNYHTIQHEELREHIDKFGIQFYQKNQEPEGWKTFSIEDIGLILNSKRIPLNSREREKRKGKFPYYGASGIVDHIDDYIFEGEHVLISEDGENLRSRQTPIAFKVTGKFWVNNHAHIFKGKKNWLNDFVVHYIQNTNLKPYITGAVQPKLSKESLLRIPIRIKNEKWAFQIASILSSLDEKIELNLQMNKTLEAIILVTFERLNSGNNTQKLGEIINLNPRMSLQKGKVVKYLGMSDVPEVGMSVSGYAEKEFSSGSKFQKHDTLLARITPCLENGKTAFVNFLKNGEIAFGSTEFIVMRAKKGVSPYLVYALSRNRNFREYAIKSMTGTSGRQRVQTDLLNDFRVAKISSEAMDLFHETVEPLFVKIKKNASQISVLAFIRDLLLPRLMSGKIRVD